MTSLEERLEALEEQAELLVDSVDLDTVWIIWCGIMVFCECCAFDGVELPWRQRRKDPRASRSATLHLLDWLCCCDDLIVVIGDPVMLMFDAMMHSGPVSSPISVSGCLIFERWLQPTVAHHS